ncbi:dynamin family protein [Sphaerobacter thermophilus]|uniref:Dynamin family protein n=1 Tax=Sphaerobacter thermophilus (strain ATCC 49802 / DSM 20745 / KCCM 41009 / NCIMB 13125 / S 6022) TaxID=479434 RepID=D1C1K7_SPHTD|nr:dynamin family protein [Sphaerobacter thermophilus]ACZ38124.1 Dynamin family protein [Sphaerobacter thermophilus DSM 20745]PZN67216.1 MAG: dynamin [Sphaerobacter thermophilus]
MSDTPALPPDRILSGREEEMRQRAAGIVEELARTIRQFPAEAEDLDLLRDAAERLGALFLLVIAGEFNSGKSAVVNALLNDTVMPEGVTPTTSAIHILRYGPSTNEVVGIDGIVEHTYPADFLRDVNLVDTPGTNAIIREHEALSQRFVPRADLVLFVTSADRPFTESERQFMTEIRGWGKKIVVVLNKIDLLRNDEEIAEVIEFIRTNSVRLLGLEPQIFPVSARLAREAQTSEAPEERERLWAASRFGALEEFILSTLDEQTRIRLKLLNPLGIADRVGGRYRAIAAERLDLLDRDLQTIERIEQRIAVFESEMRADFTAYLSRIEAIVYRMNERADRFFDRTIRLGRVFDLLDRERIQREFEQEVIADTEQQIDAAVAEMIDWMVERDLRLWQSVTEYIDRRQLDRHQDEVVGESGAQFTYDRQALLGAVARRAGEVVEQFDPGREAQVIAEALRGAVTQTAVAEVGAIGLGAAVIALATTAAMDVTGILAAVTVGGLGLLILPARKRHARELLRRRSVELRERLAEALSDQFDREVRRSTARVRDALSPYATFVRTERDRFQRLAQALEAVDADITELRRVLEG